METYESMRAFADSWGLLFMAGVFVVAVLYTLRPGSKKLADEAASIPLKED
ncbi:cbb3-type cytochrome c oxidase subunit 3 [Rhizobium alvei]|jgi:cytochrome c oxidase cbb3-type subunit 4|uniref:Cbb3-type cytochrome c oxidase subunit 3 n=1 Tax=Rhizobium alvei TaxID=1132659 RepID=A0ABT8YHW3_9HYPH|nr:cbb3-type cytochrome c oxidase subunit 3 [Rhizobium alvei]MDO6963270.1 cbb3-type cytochrome c oxidase subunit 3 [Rhizobium alvei]